MHIITGENPSLGNELTLILLHFTQLVAEGFSDFSVSGFKIGMVALMIPRLIQLLNQTGNPFHFNFVFFIHFIYIFPDPIVCFNASGGWRTGIVLSPFKCI